MEYHTTIAIAQQRDIERYKRVRGGGWDRPKAKFEPGDYVMLKQAKHTALEPIASTCSTDCGDSTKRSWGEGGE